jgi:hypothetical protein
MEAATNAPFDQRRGGGAVNIRGLVRKDGDDNNDPHRGVRMTPLVTKKSASHAAGPEEELNDEDEDTPPLIF